MVFAQATTALPSAMSGRWISVVPGGRTFTDRRSVVNARRTNGECGTGRVTFTLARKPGQSAFEGELQRDAAPVPSQVTLAP